MWCELVIHEEDLVGGIAVAGLSAAMSAVCALAVLTALPPLLRAVPQESQQLTQGLERVRAKLERGAYADAEADARQLNSAAVVAFGSESIEVARVGDVIVEALIRNGRSGLPSTLAFAENVVKDKERHQGVNDTETALSLHNLGGVRLERGEFSAALNLFERSLTIRLQRLEPDASPVADSLDQIGLALVRMERFEEAKEKLLRAHAIREMRSANEPLRLAQTLELMAWLYRYSGDFRAAQAPLDQAVEIRKRLAPEHPDTAFTLQLSGDVLWHGGQIERAKTLWLDGLALVERTIGRDHPATVGFERRLALASDAQGDRAETRRLLGHAMETSDRWFAACSPELLAVRVQAASSLQYDGEYPDARRRYQQSLAACEACLGPNHSRAATIVYNLAVLEHQMGNEKDAERLYARVIRIWSSRLGPAHWYVARGLDGLAEVAAAQGQLERARLLYSRALAIRRRSNADHPDVAWTLTNLARVSADSGGLAAAEQYVRQAIDIFTRTGASDEPDHFARVLALRGDIQSRRGDYASARASFDEALSRRERIFGPAHPLAAESRAQLAAANLQLGFPDTALAQALSAEQTGRLHLQFTVRYLPERQALVYAAKRPRALDLALSIAGSTTDSLEIIFNEVILSRGVILDELVARARASNAQNPKTMSLSASATRARQRFANLIVKSLQEPVGRDVLDEARQQKEDAERALAENSVEAGAEIKRARLGLKDVESALPRGSALVSFVTFDRTIIGSKGRQFASPKPARSYGAFVHKAGAHDVAFVQLGAAASIEGLIRAWRLQATSPGPRRTYQTAAAALRRAVWDPLSPYLEDADRIFIIPDGLLSIVNIAALPDRTGHYLAEGPEVIHYLSTERDLVIAADPAGGRGVRRWWCRIWQSADENRHEAGRDALGVRRTWRRQFL